MHITNRSGFAYLLFVFVFLFAGCGGNGKTEKEPVPEKVQKDDYIGMAYDDVIKLKGKPQSEGALKSTQSSTSKNNDDEVCRILTYKDVKLEFNKENRVVSVTTRKSLANIASFNTHELIEVIMTEAPPYTPAKALLVKKGQSAVPALIDALKKNPSSEFMEVLAEIGDKSAVPVIRKLLLESTDEYWRGSAIKALGMLRDKDAVSYLVELLKSEGELKEVIIGALGQIGDHSASEAILELLGDKDMMVRIAAIESLGKLKEEKAVPVFVNIIKKTGADSWGIDYDEVLTSLLRIGTPDSISVFMDEFRKKTIGKNKNNHINNFMTCIPREENNKLLIPVLIDCLDAWYSKPNAVEAVKTLQMLQKISDQDFGKDFDKWREWWAANKDSILKKAAGK